MNFLLLLLLCDSGIRIQKTLLTFLFIVWWRLLFGIDSPLLSHLFLCALLTLHFAISGRLFASGYRLLDMLGTLHLMIEVIKELVPRRNFAWTLKSIEVDHIVKILDVIVRKRLLRQRISHIAIFIKITFTLDNGSEIHIKAAISTASRRSLGFIMRLNSYQIVSLVRPRTLQLIGLLFKWLLRLLPSLPLHFMHIYFNLPGCFAFL